MDLWSANRDGVRDSAYRDSCRSSTCCFMLPTTAFFKPPLSKTCCLQARRFWMPSALRYCDCRCGRAAGIFMKGVTKAFFGKLRLDANIFRRDFRQYSDDDVLLDTGVSFPIAFTKARLFGEEIRLDVPQWGRFSGYLSYANQSGYGQGPITGGLFLGSDADNALTDTSKFAVKQDQRNSLSARVRFQAPRRIWLA